MEDGKATIETRQCVICDDSLLEDEFHFALFCEGLVPERTNLFSELQNKANMELEGLSQEELLKTMLSKSIAKFCITYQEGLPYQI